MIIHAKWKAWPNQARRRPSTDVDGRRRAWCEWAFTLNYSEFRFHSVHAPSPNNGL